MQSSPNQQAKRTMTPWYHDTTSDTTVPRNHDAGESRADEDIAEVVRKAVKHFGKEAATHRFTLDEKNLLADIEYTYRRQGIKTSENEITRLPLIILLRITGERARRACLQQF
jgi:hypothetical protein